MGVLFFQCVLFNDRITGHGSGQSSSLVSTYGWLVNKEKIRCFLQQQYCSFHAMIEVDWDEDKKYFTMQFWLGYIIPCSFGAALAICPCSCQCQGLATFE